MVSALSNFRSSSSSRDTCDVGRQIMGEEEMLRVVVVWLCGVSKDNDGKER